MSSCHPCFRRATTSVLAAVALISGAILLLGDRFDGVPRYAFTPAAHDEALIAACVAEESMRLINPEQERCQPDEVQLASARTHPSGEIREAATGPAGPPGPPGRVGADGVSGFEIVAAKVTVASRASHSGEARCPPGKVAVGGGVLPDPESSGKGGAPEHRMAVVISAPLLPGGDGGSGWTVTIKNTSAAPLFVVVAATCVTSR